MDCVSHSDTVTFEKQLHNTVVYEAVVCPLRSGPP